MKISTSTLLNPDLDPVTIFDILPILLGLRYDFFAGCGSGPLPKSTSIIKIKADSSFQA